MRDGAILKALYACRQFLVNEQRYRVGPARWRDVNDLKAEKPVVLLYEHPWHEMDTDGSLTLRCQDPFLRDVEQRLRREIYQLTHTPGDMIVSDGVECPMKIEHSGFGLEVREDILRTDERNHIVAHAYKPQLAEADDVGKIVDPVIEVNREETRAREERLRDALGPDVPVRLVGMRGFNLTLWDDLIRWTGVEDGLAMLALDPDLVHAFIRRYMQAQDSALRQCERMGALSSNCMTVRVGSGGYGYTDALEGDDLHALAAPVNQMWGFATSQIFADVSPAMHEEFAMAYERPWLERFGLSYYGCCEPLHKKTALLSRVKNLRKISVSAWANIAEMAEFCRGKYVMSVKPSPAIFLTSNWGEDNVVAQINHILDNTKGCAVEIVMKDISTSDNHPHRLWVWEQIARDLIDRRFS